ncbi:MAG: hypothetical protein IKQ44_14615 [Lachnospiraceae bacterium]|nr:hypothetical protein [Lachnospiraceae bacterium]
MTGKPITVSKDLRRQEVINKMKARGVCITKSPNSDLFFIESDNYKTTKELARFRIGCKHGFLVFPKVGDCFYSATEAFEPLYYAYACLENGDPDEDF